MRIPDCGSSIARNPFRCRHRDDQRTGVRRLLGIGPGCDIRVASDQAVFALSELRNTGSFPGAGGPVRLAKMVGTLTPA